MTNIVRWTLIGSEATQVLKVESEFEVEAVLQGGSNEYIMGVTTEMSNSRDAILKTGEQNWLHVIGERHGHASWAREVSSYQLISREKGQHVRLRYAVIDDVKQVTFSCDDTLTSGPHQLPEGSCCFCLLTNWEDTSVAIEHKEGKRSGLQISNKLFSERKFTDARILCEGVEINVHRAVLAAASPVFERMLESEMCEGTSATIEIQDASREAVEIMVQYMYTEELLESDKLPELFMLGNKYMIPGLETKIGDLMVHKIDETNGRDILQAVRHHGNSSSEDSTEVWEKLMAKLHSSRDLMQGVLEKVFSVSPRA
eukprot:TRINITY_DN26710_c0_g1_i1.p1 TRINITY_DN26710_c0_g1~~TRINITY_DN26710_c0_g1_i1.p1  ORF type:complete len:329 (+),score=64.02 TRINITY_DN26710_c0_g1_i1:48-989(+)